MAPVLQVIWMIHTGLAVHNPLAQIYALSFSHCKERCCPYHARLVAVTNRVSQSISYSVEVALTSLV
jgi:hypothetical protein